VDAGVTQAYGAEIGRCIRECKFEFWGRYHSLCMDGGRLCIDILCVDFASGVHTVMLISAVSHAAS
jgi:hypothetical protein